MSKKPTKTQKQTTKTRAKAKGKRASNKSSKGADNKLLQDLGAYFLRLKNGAIAKEFFTRDFAIFAGFLILFWALFLMGIKSDDQQASMFADNVSTQQAQELRAPEIPVNSFASREQKLITNLIDGDWAKIEQVKAINGGKQFTRDLARGDEVFNLRFEEFREGFMASYSATENGDNVLHPFFGFFVVENEQISEIIWGKNATAKILNRQGSKVTLVNTSDFPWNTENSWEDYTTGAPVRLKPVAGDSIIEPGETAEVRISGRDSEVMLKNHTHGFFLVGEER
jgi:hypothetical protein